MAGNIGQTVKIVKYLFLLADCLPFRIGAMTCRIMNRQERRGAKTERAMRFINKAPVRLQSADGGFVFSWETGDYGTLLLRMPRTVASLSAFAYRSSLFTSFLICAMTYTSDPCCLVFFPAHDFIGPLDPSSLPLPVFANGRSGKASSTGVY